MSEDGTKDKMDAAAVLQHTLWEPDRHELYAAGVRMAGIAVGKGRGKRLSWRRYSHQLETVLLALGVCAEPSAQYDRKEMLQRWANTDERFTNRRFEP